MMIGEKEHVTIEENDMRYEPQSEEEINAIDRLNKAYYDSVSDDSKIVDLDNDIGRLLLPKLSMFDIGYSRNKGTLQVTKGIYDWMVVDEQGKLESIFFPSIDPNDVNREKRYLIGSLAPTVALDENIKIIRIKLEIQYQSFSYGKTRTDPQRGLHLVNNSRKGIEYWFQLLGPPTIDPTITNFYHKDILFIILFHSMYDCLIFASLEQSSVTEKISNQNRAPKLKSFTDYNFCHELHLESKIVTVKDQEEEGEEIEKESEINQMLKNNIHIGKNFIAEENKENFENTNKLKR